MHFVLRILKVLVLGYLESEWLLCLVTFQEGQQSFLLILKVSSCQA